MQRKIKKAMDWILFNKCSIQIEINGRKIGKEKGIGFLECNSRVQPNLTLNEHVKLV